MTATKISKYADASLYEMARVVTAAEDLYCIIAEYPDEPEYWDKELEMLEHALGYCKGTNAHYHGQKLELAKTEPQVGGFNI